MTGDNCPQRPDIPAPPNPEQRSEPLPECQPKPGNEDPCAPDRIQILLDSPSYRRADQDVDFLERDEAHGLRLHLDYLKPELLLKEQGSRYLYTLLSVWFEWLLVRRDYLRRDAGEEADPRAELVRRLQEYERFKQAAEDLDALPRLDRDVFPTQVDVPVGHVRKIPPPVDLQEVLLALKEVLARADLFTHHRVEREPLSLRERMAQVLDRLHGDHFAEFTELFDFSEGRSGVVVTFLAVLELIKASLVELVQAEPFAPIHVRARAG